MLTVARQRWPTEQRRSLTAIQAARVGDRSLTAGETAPKQEPTMDALRTAYDKTALARMGIPFERAIEIEAVRIALEGSARRCAPQPAVQSAKDKEAA